MDFLTDMGTWAVILVGVLLTPMILRVLKEWLSVLLTAVAKVLPVLGHWTKSLLKNAGSILGEGHISLNESIAQTGGALLMLTIGGILGMCDLELTLSTVSPLLGMTYTESDFKFDYMIAVSLVLSGLVFGFVMMDLMKWTALTRFVTAEEGRASLFVCALGLLLATLGVALALAGYRFGVMVWGDTEEVFSMMGISYTDLPFYILATLAVLYLLGAGLAFASLDNFFGVLAAVFMFGTSIFTGTLWLLLATLNVIIELLLKGIIEIIGFGRECRRGLQEAKQHFEKREPSFKKLRVMVAKHPEAYEKANQASAQNGSINP